MNRYKTINNNNNNQIILDIMIINNNKMMMMSFKMDRLDFKKEGRKRV